MLDRNLQSKQMMNARRFFIATLLCSTVLGGCATPPPPPPPLPPTVVKATFVATADVNVDEHGRPNPIVVHVFELGGLGKFQGADYFSLLESPAAVVGAEMLNHQELQLVPGGVDTVAKTITSNAVSMGVVAGYRDITGIAWRTAFALPPNQTTTVTVTVGRQGMVLQKVIEP